MVKEKEVSHSLNLLAKTSFIVVIGLGLSKVFSYIYRIIAARAFGPEAYGYFSLATVISGFFISVAAVGLADGVLRYIAIYRGRKQPERIGYLFRSSTLLLSITSIITGIILFFLSKIIAVGIFHDANLIPFLEVFSLSIPLALIATPLLSGIRAFERITAYSGIYNMFQNISKVIILALFIYAGFGPQSISWSYIVSLGAMLIVAYVYAKRNIPELFSADKLDNKQKKQMIAEVIRYSWPLLFYWILTTILYWIDSFSIGYYKNATAVGLYNAAVPIALLLTFVPELFTQLFVPMINKYYAANKKSTVKEISKQMSKWIWAIDLPIFIIMFAFPGAIMNVLFGSEYLVASTALRILSVSMLFTAMGVISSSLVSMKGKSKMVLLNIILASAMNVILNSIFVPMQKIWFVENSLGINGAAIATVISMIFFNLLFFFQAYKYTGISPLRRKMINVTASAIIPTIILYILHRTLVHPSIITLTGMGLIFVVTYVIMLFLLKSFDSHDREVMKKVMSRVSYLKVRTNSQE
jgi:O-antigen/teichoic acid export membrane protein